MILKDFLNINLSIYTIPEIYLFSITLSKVKANITQDPTFLMEMKTFTSGHVVLENKDVLIREIKMGGGNGVASVIMLTFPSEPCPHADFSK